MDCFAVLAKTVVQPPRHVYDMPPLQFGGELLGLEIAATIPHPLSPSREGGRRSILSRGGICGLLRKACNDRNGGII